MVAAAGAPAIVDCHWLAPVAAGTAAGGQDDNLALLDARERQRAAAFRRARDRDRYIASHAQARRLIGARLGVDPARLPWQVTPNGKPFVALPGMTTRPCHFSLSHSGDAAWLAVAAVPVGLDVEVLVPPADLASLIDRSCSASEQAALQALDERDQPAAFLALWTRKEAALKAWGLGLGLVEPACLTVGLEAGLNARLKADLMTGLTADLAAGRSDGPVQVGPVECPLAPERQTGMAGSGAALPLAIQTLVREGAVLSVAAAWRPGLQLRLHAPPQA